MKIDQIKVGDDYVLGNGTRARVTAIVKRPNKNWGSNVKLVRMLELVLVDSDGEVVSDHRAIRTARDLRRTWAEQERINRAEAAKRDEKAQLSQRMMAVLADAGLAGGQIRVVERYGHDGSHFEVSWTLTQEELEKI